MNQLNAVITHLPAEEAMEDLQLLRRIAPDSRFIACYNGTRSEFERLDDAVLIERDEFAGDPRTFQSYHAVLEALAGQDFDSVLLLEYDQLVLDPGFERAMIEIAERTGAGFMGKDCVRRERTNWPHYARFRRDRDLFDHLRSISVREDPTAIYGTLGTGMWLSRPALDSYLSLEGHPRCYGELYVPTVLHHLGHEVVSIDAESDLYRHVRWDPDFELDEIRALQRAGAAFVHPVKSAEVRGAALGEGRADETA
jgi:hypothetical protein